MDDSNLSWAEKTTKYLDAKHSPRPTSSPHIFSGDYSRPMWDAINKAKSKKDLRDALYLVCCRLQELETALAKHGIVTGKGETSATAISGKKLKAFWLDSAMVPVPEHFYGYRWQHVEVGDVVNLWPHLEGPAMVGAVTQDRIILVSIGVETAKLLQSSQES